MAVRYLIENIIDETTLCCTSSEDDLYVKEFLYNKRPSKPFRFTGVGSAGDPEWICIESTVSGGERVTFAGIFNHNLTALAGGNDELRLKFCSDPCEESGSCDWDAPDVEIDLKPRMITNRNDLYRITDQTYPSIRFDFIDENNGDGFIEVGELVLGLVQSFGAGVHLQPGRADGPAFYRGNKRTDYGMDWPVKLADSERLDLTFVNVGDPTVQDEIQTFLLAVENSGGKFIIVPDDALKFCYYVMIDKDSDFAERGPYCPTDELRTWTMPLKTLSKGIRLL